MEAVALILSNVLTAIYQPFWYALLLSVFVMFFYLYAFDGSEAGNGWKNICRIWINHFKISCKFRDLFFITFYTTMILFRTLINRSMWINPVSNVIGDWWIYVVDKNTGQIKLTTECVENTILFIPFVLMIMLYNKRFICEKKPVFSFGILLAFGVSLIIETLQLFLHLGTFQLSDLFYNTFGGFIGECIYWIYIGIVQMRDRGGIHGKIQK